MNTSVAASAALLLFSMYPTFRLGLSALRCMRGTHFYRYRDKASTPSLLTHVVDIRKLFKGWTPCFLIFARASGHDRIENVSFFLVFDSVAVSI
jgi:hypothetical protein